MQLKEKLWLTWANAFGNYHKALKINATVRLPLLSWGHLYPWNSTVICVSLQKTALINSNS